MFHHSHTSIDTCGKGRVRNILKDNNILTMRQSKDLNKKKLRTYLHHSCKRVVLKDDGSPVLVFNELNIPFFHGTEL